MKSATIDSAMPFQVVVAGAGVAGLEAALALRALAGDLVAVELIAPESEFTYRPLAVVEPFHVGEVQRFPLQSLVEGTGATLRRGTVTAVGAEEKIVTLESGEVLSYDAFVVALGATPREAVAGALTFRGTSDAPALAALLERTTAGELRHLAFVVPTTTTWPLPLYELALLTAEYLTDRGTRGVEISIVTPEDRPLALFGVQASDAIRELLDIRGIRFEPGVAPLSWDAGVLHLSGENTIEADAAVALPHLTGPYVAGLPQDSAGFVPTDTNGRVHGLTDVYAAGDATQFPLKQGGIAAQQADAVAEAIAEEIGAPVTATPFRPVLRGMLLTGFVPRFLRSEVGAGQSVIDTEPLWWPPAKIVGRYLAPFLAAQLGLRDEVPAASRAGAVPVEVELDPTDHTLRSPV